VKDPRVRVRVRKASPPRKVVVCYPRGAFERFVSEISWRALSAGAEMMGAWLGTAIREGDTAILLALKPFILEPKESAAAHAVLDGMTLLDLERLGSESNLAPVVIAHTHNWRGGHAFFSATDRRSAELLLSPLLAFAVIDPYTRSVSHWRVVDGELERVEHRIIDDGLAFLTREGTAVPIEARGPEGSLRRLQEAVSAIDAALISLSRAVQLLDAAASALSLEADRVLLSLAPQLRKRRSLLVRLLGRLGHD